MKLALEVHRYAPELNKAICLRTGTTFPVPGVFTIAAARRVLFPRLQRRGHFLTMKCETDPVVYSREMKGMVRNLEAAKTLIRGFRAYHNLPGTKFEFGLKLVG